MSVLRITSGLAKGKKLKSPNIEKYRATQEVVKLCIFSILDELILNAVCLDLYAGSGNLGIEALSRGAKWCDFVDEDKDAIKTIQENLINCKLEEKSAIIQSKCTKFVANTTNKYDLIFLDPFFDDTSHKFLLQNIEEILKTKGFAIFTHAHSLDISDNIAKIDLKALTTRKFGKTVLTILTRS